MSFPEQFGRYQVLSVLGQGAMGLVYKAVDPVIERAVAIKVIQANPGLGDADLQRMQARFEQEFRSAGALSHPNIVTVFDVGKEGDHYYVAMEFVDGRALDSVLAERGVLPFAEVAELAAQLAGALDYAHGQGVVHRDIKPANVMMTGGGAAKVTDFGLAKLEATTLTRTGALVGTPAYMSPEQVGGHTITGKSDQFSLGILLYQALTGERPFTADSPSTIMYKIVHEEPLPPSHLNKSLPEAVDHVLVRCLQKDVNRRFPSCSEMAAALRQALGMPSIVIGSGGAGARPADVTVLEAGGPRGAETAVPVSMAPSMQAPPASMSAAPSASGAPAEATPAGTGSGSVVPTAGHTLPGWALGLAIGAPSLALVALVAWLALGPWSANVAPPGGAVGGSGGSPTASGEAAGPPAGDRDTETSSAAQPETTTGAEPAAGAPPTAGGGNEAGATRSQDPRLSAPASGDGAAAAGVEPNRPSPPPRPARISYAISSEPPGALIMLDGERQQQVTPAEVMLDTTKDHHIEIAARGYESARTDVRVAGIDLDDVPRSLHVVLPRADSVAANRAGRSFRGSRQQGSEGLPEELRNAMASGQVSSGHVVIDTPIAVGVRIVPASRDTLPALLIERLRNASPDVRRRLAAGFFLSPGTHHEVDLPAGQWRIALTAVRVLYYHEEHVLLKPEQTLSLGGEIPATFYRVEISSQPAGARVRVDGLTPIATPYSGPIPPGEHELEFMWADGTASVRVRIDRDGQQVVGTRQPHRP